VAEVAVIVDRILIGCASCGYSIGGRPDEIELLVSVMPTHVGHLTLAERMSINGDPFRWYGDPDLVRSAVDLAAG
jgi:hypothetical protein